MSDSQAVMEATASVYVAGRRAGSAVLVDDRHLLTAAHVLRIRSAENLQVVAADEIEVAFPRLGTTRGAAKRVLARPLELPGDEPHADVAVIEVGEHAARQLPKPVELWSASSLPERVRMFGYPLAERELVGVWRAYLTSGPTIADTVQLDWVGEAGALPGQNGGPVVDSDHATLVGVLVASSSQGRFDRFVPITRIADAWPDLPRPSLSRGLLAPEDRPTAARGEGRGFNDRKAKLFISYSHRDQRHRERLEIHLASLRREGAIAEWHDRMITPGEEWSQAIDKNLEAAACVLLLVTPDFLASDYCYSVEMQRALEKHRSGHVLVIPVIVRPADWQRTPLGDLQALPKDAKPVVEWASRDRAWLSVTEGLRLALVHLWQ